jgi:hypothetical protein
VTIRASTIVVVAQDITQWVQRPEDLDALRFQQKDLLPAMLGHEMRNPSGRCAWRSD